MSKRPGAYIVEDFGGIPSHSNPPFSDLSTPLSKKPGLYQDAILSLLENSHLRIFPRPAVPFCNSRQQQQ